MTITGLCIFLDIDETTWRAWKADRSDFSPIITRAEAIIYSQKFEGASAGLLVANIIARDLGLSEKSEITGKGGGPVETVNLTMTPKQAAEAYAETLRNYAQGHDGD